MNIYNLHSNPESLNFYEKVFETNPDFFWEKYKDSREELKKREKHIAKYANFAYYYAKDTLKGPFPLGEEAITKDVMYTYLYARHALKRPFPAGEAAIAKFEHIANHYAENVLKKNFYLNGKLIVEYKP